MTDALNGIDVCENMQSTVSTVHIKENNYLTMSREQVLEELRLSNIKAEQAGWKNPKEIKPIVYDEKRKCRIV